MLSEDEASPKTNTKNLGMKTFGILRKGLSFSPIENHLKDFNPQNSEKTKKKNRIKIPFTQDMKLKFFYTIDSKLSYIAEAANNYLYKNLKQAIEDYENRNSLTSPKVNITFTFNVPGFLKKELEPSNENLFKNEWSENKNKIFELKENQFLSAVIFKQKFLIDDYLKDKAEKIRKFIKIDNLDPKERRYKVVEKIIEICYEKLKSLIINETDPKICNAKTFEHFIIFFINYSCYFTGLKCNVIYNKIFVILEFYAEDEILEILAEKFNYIFNLKILANLKIFNVHKDNDLDEDIDGLRTIVYDQESKTHRIVKDLNEKNEIQYEQINPEDISFFTPYMKYSDKYKDYYRRYTANDKYHDCKFLKKNTDEEKENLMVNHECSLFRNIDRLRLINISLNYLVDMEILKTFYFFNSVTFLRNSEAYNKEFSKMKMIKDYLPPLESESVNRFNFTLRNYFGEKVAYYFVFLSHFLKWMLFPSVFGLIFTFLSKLFPEYNSKKDLNFIRCYLDVSFIFVIIIWAIMYIKSWSCNQKYYNCIWGMDEINSHHKQNGKCVITRAMVYLNVQIPLVKKFDKYCRIFLSVIVSIFMAVITILTNLFLFYFFEIQVLENNNKTNSGTTSRSVTSMLITKPSADMEVQSDFWYFVIPILNVLLRNISSFINYYVCKWITNNENHTMQDSYEDSLTIKIILYEFVNYYFNLFYIAYFKSYYEICVDNDCFEELGHQLTIIIITSNIINIIQLFLPFVIEKFRNTRLKFWTSEETKRMKIILKPDYHEYMCYEYLDIVLKYGYVILFGIASPTCFFLILTTVWLKRFVNSYKMVHIFNVPMIEGSSGVGIILKIMKIFTLIGIITNTTISFNNLEIIKSYSFKWPLILFVQNFMTLVFFLFNFDSLPSWFKYIHLIKYNYIVKIMRSDYKDDLIDEKNVAFYKKKDKKQNESDFSDFSN